MALSRSLYSTQFLELTLSETGGTVISGLPVQTASIERTVPTEDIIILGKLGSVGRQQKEVESVKMDIKLFWATGSANTLSAANLNILTGNALNGTRSKVVVTPNGFTGFGILTNFGIDAGVGDFLTANMSFEGFGTPIITTAATAAASVSSYSGTSIVVYTSENVSAGASGETIKSAKFSIDIPSERLSRLGAPITGSQTGVDLTGNHLLVAKPPFKISVSYDGQFVTGAHANDPITFGHLTITPVNSNITTQSFSQNAGDVGATMSFASEGTSCTFA